MRGARALFFDTPSLYYRAFYALPISLQDVAGRPVNAVRGTLDFIAKLAEIYNPTHMICAWDESWRPSWRVQLWPSYKAARLSPSGDGVEDAPQELVTQIPRIKTVLTNLGIPIAGVPDYEADDVLASLVHRWDGEAIVATGDRDLFQLVTDSVQVAYLVKGVARHTLVGTAWVAEHYGVPADRYLDMAVLRGDPSDGLPGVRGIGERTAARLVNQYGDLTEIIAAAHDPSTDMPKAQRDRIKSATSYLEAAAQVARAVPDLDLPEVPVWHPDRINPLALDHLAKQLRLGGSAARALSVLTDLGSADQPRMSQI